MLGKPYTAYISRVGDFHDASFAVNFETDSV
jgi:hypothetical protein